MEFWSDWVDLKGICGVRSSSCGEIECAAFSSFLTGEQIFRKLLQRQGNTHRNKVFKFKLHFSRKFQVLRSTRISNTFLYNSQPRDVTSKLGLPVVEACTVVYGSEFLLILAKFNYYCTDVEVLL